MSENLITNEPIVVSFTTNPEEVENLQLDEEVIIESVNAVNIANTINAVNNTETFSSNYVVTPFSEIIPPTPPEKPKAKVEAPSLKTLLEEADKKLYEEEGTPPVKTIDESRRFITRLKKFFESARFNQKCDELSEKYHVPKKEVAKSFVHKVLGTISDVLHVVVGGIELVASNVVKILSYVLLSGINVICNLARALSRAITLNKTCVE